MQLAWVLMLFDIFRQFPSVSKNRASLMAVGGSAWKSFFKATLLLGARMLTRCKTLTQRVSPGCLALNKPLWQENKLHKWSDDSQIAVIQADSKNTTFYQNWLLRPETVCITSACFFISILNRFQSPCLCPLNTPQPVCILIFSAASLSIHQPCGGLSEVTEPSFLAVSGYHHKGLHATYHPKGPL